MHNISLDNIIDKDDLHTVFRLCIMSKFVQSNKRYRECADNTEFIYAINDNSINAYANHDGTRYTVTLLRGILQWGSVFGFIWMLADNGQKFKVTLKMATWAAMYLQNKYQGELPDCLIEEMVNGCGIKHPEKLLDSINQGKMEQWRSCTLEIVRSVLAHELGHVCLGHVDDCGYDGTIMSANRNIERQADLFACSVLQSGSNVQSAAIATVLSEISLLCFGNGDGQKTHPASKERINYMMKSFEGLFGSQTMGEPQLIAIATAILNVGKTKSTTHRLKNGRLEGAPVSR